jgi:hypothetical protein
MVFVDSEENKRRKCAMVPLPLRTSLRAGPDPHVAASFEKRNGSESVEDLLHTLRSALPAPLAERLRAGAAPVETAQPPRLATGIESVDLLLRGGLPRGRLCEITGSPSSGRTSLALALLATATRAGELAAVVDAADAFDPASAAAAGVHLERVLWARAPRLREALRCTERLLEARGFGVVLVDLDGSKRDFDAGARDASSTWLRMSQSARASGTTLLLLASRMRAGPFAALTLEARGERAHFDPPHCARSGWLEGLSARVAPLRSRIGASSGSATVRWKSRAG